MERQDTLNPLTWLEGLWKTEGFGSGKYPTIKNFNYLEEINITPIAQFKFNYVAQSWHPESKKPMHRETGFLEITPGTNKVSLTLKHNFGLETYEHGTVTDQTINLESVQISRPIENKLPAVTQLSRMFKLDGDCLEQVLLMATSNNLKLTEHLRAKYKKKCEEA